MRVLFATSECVPFFKIGGLGDVSHSLPVALSRLGVSMVVALPFYEKIKVKHTDLKCLGPLAVDFAGKRELVFVFQTHIPKTSVTVILFRHPRMLLYKDNPFPFYCVCIATWLKQLPYQDFKPFDIIQCNDWHTALIPLLLGENNKAFKQKGTLQSDAVKTMITIHNLLYQGVIRLSTARYTGLPVSVFRKIPSPEGGVVNLFREGLEHADVVSTVSPSYAKEILTPEFGPHIFDTLRRRHDKIVGILNGIDLDEWDPAKDQYVPVHYTRHTVVRGKAENKTRLQKAVGLPVSDSILFGFVGRIEPMQKGVDLIMKAVRQLPKKSFQLVLLGTGNAKQVKELEHLDRQYDHVSYIKTFDERLARRIYAGSDVLLVPSKFEPCGLTQMIAMRYGAIPLVRKTGGLADSVDDGITGLVFDKYVVEDLCKVMWRAIIMREDHPKAWLSMVRRIMREDFSWKRSAKEYIEVYKKLVARDSA